ncbi:MAG: type I secretion system permease/ATPase [Aliiglaciecola sp.]|uniref:type I secretion system permease/ATPase n=1 Tax=Aliiglaciecola sp. TaxID=1872441 RepID=UPI003296D7ED
MISTRPMDSPNKTQEYANTSDSLGGVLMDCLDTICHFHGVAISRVSILSGLPLKDDFISPSGFDRAAKRAGFTSKTVKRKFEHMNSALFPAVLVLRDHQACILLSLDINNNKAEVVFPELNDSSETIDLSELKENYSGYVIFVRPTKKINKVSEIADKTDQKNWFWSVVNSSKSLYRDVIAASIFISLLSITVPLFIMNVYDRVVPNAALETLWVLAIGVLIALFSDFTLRVLRHYFVEMAASRVDVSLSSILLHKVLGIRFEEKPNSTGAFINSLQSFEAIRGFLSSITLVALVDLPFALIFVVIICLIDWYLILPILFGGACILLYGLYAQKTLRSLSSDAIKISSSRSSLLTESLGSFEQVKFFGLSGYIQHEWERQSVFLAKVNAKMRLIGASVNNLALWLQQGVGVSIMIVGVYLIIDGQITQGGLIAAYLLSSRAMGPLSMAAGLLAQYHHAATSLQTLNDLMAKKVESPPEKQWSEHTNIDGDLKFESVSFSYPEKDSQVLCNISFTLKAGERVAILGKNGCGKSTLNKLILKAHKPKSGLITLDNIDLQQYEPQNLRKLLSYIPQDIVLFSGSLKDNICAFDNSIDTERVWEVIKDCGLIDFVNSHPDGIFMNVGERGELLSGGQRQAVAIARALIKKSSVYILDEPTSSMDSGVEQQLKKLLQREVIGKTLILNTHRQTLLDLVDRIIILDKGKIVADGPKNVILRQLSTTNAVQKEQDKQGA